MTKIVVSKQNQIEQTCKKIDSYSVSIEMWIAYRWMYNDRC